MSIDRFYLTLLAPLLLPIEAHAQYVPYTQIATHQNRSGSPVGIIIIFSIFGTLLLAAHIVDSIMRKKELATAETQRVAAEAKDPIWSKELLDTTATTAAKQYFQAYADRDFQTLQSMATPDFAKRLALEMAALVGSQRKMVFEKFTIENIELVKIDDEEDDTKDSFAALVSTGGTECYVDLARNETYIDRLAPKYSFVFTRAENSWLIADVLLGCTFSAGGEVFLGDANLRPLPPTESESIRNKSYAAIALLTDKFGFISDLGLAPAMRPRHGALFETTPSGGRELQNFIIGYYEEKVALVYRCVDYQEAKNERYPIRELFVTQTFLPKSYPEIYIHHKSLLDSAPSGTVKRTLESNEFAKEYNVYSTPDASMETFELLAPNFMQRLMDLPFLVMIEVVGNSLYFITDNLGTVDGQTMIDLLSYAFDELKV